MAPPSEPVGSGRQPQGPAAASVLPPRPGGQPLARQPPQSAPVSPDARPPSSLLRRSPPVATLPTAAAVARAALPLAPGSVAMDAPAAASSAVATAGRQPSSPPSPAASTAAGDISPFSAWVRSFTAGGLAGAIAKTSVAPLDRVKVLMQTSSLHALSRISSSGTPYPSILSCLVHITKSDGPTGLFRGNGAMVARIFPYAAVQYTAFETFNMALSMYLFGADSRSPLKRFLAGAAAGTTAVFMTYPLDLARTRMALRTGPGGAGLAAATASAVSLAAPAGVRPAAAASATPPHGIFGTLRRVVAKDGPVGLYRGLYPTLAGVVPYAGTNFFMYGVLKGHAEGAGFVDTHPVMTSLACGASAGLAAQTLTYPLDVVRRREQASDLLRGTQREFFAVPLRTPVASAAAGGAIGTAAAGAATSAPAGATATASLPSAVVASLRGGGSAPTMRRRLSITKAISVIVREEGLRGLYRGLSLTFFKTAPGIAVSFTVYDALKRSLGVPSGKYAATSA